MTRINVVHPSLLTDKHLLAEWHEIGRVVTLAERGVDPASIPDRYVLGAGHMKFFADKLGYIAARASWLRLEMRRRGFFADRNKLTDLVGRIIIVGFGPKIWGPDNDDKMLNLCRLMERAPDHRAYIHEYDFLSEAQNARIRNPA